MSIQEYRIKHNPSGSSLEIGVHGEQYTHYGYTFDQVFGACYVYKHHQQENKFAVIDQDGKTIAVWSE